jgi:signal transduction histidine kinase
MPGALSSTSVENVLRDVRDGFPGSVGRIELEIQSDLPSLPADPVMLHEIVANLVDNALKYSSADAAVHVSARREDGSLVIRVRDRGDGIAPGDLPRIFDRFTQLDQSSTRAHGGVGLGLHLVRELTRRLDGDVAVESVVGSGTVFTVTIPINAAHVVEAPTSQMTRA